MALPIRQGATHKVVIGPVVAVGDGFTPVTTLAVSSADEAEVILHDNGTVVDISGYTFAAITTADGYYHLTLQTGISNTVGHMTVVINDDSLCLPVKADFIVLDTGIYDSLYADGALALASATDLATVDTNVDAILVDTGTSIPALLPAALVGGRIDADIGAKTGNVALSAQEKLDVNAEADTAITDAALATATNLATVDTNVDAILVDTADMQPKLGTPAADLAADVAAVKVDTAATLVDTADMQPKIGTPAADVSADIAAVKVDTAATLLDTAEIGAAGAGLTDLGGMSTGMKAEVNTEVDGAFTTQMADSVAADGVIATREQAIYAVLQFLTERAVSATTVTVKKVDGSSTLFTMTLDDGTTPTSITRS